MHQPLTAARYAALETTSAGVFAWPRRWVRIVGIGLMAVLALGAPLWQAFFHTESMLPFILLSAGISFFLVQGVERGILQGRLAFGRLAASYQAEMWVRLLALAGLVLGVTLSFELPYTQNFDDVSIRQWNAINGVWSIREETLYQSLGGDDPAELYIPLSVAEDTPYHVSVNITLRGNTRAGLQRAARLARNKPAPCLHLPPGCRHARTDRWVHRRDGPLHPAGAGAPFD